MATPFAYPPLTAPTTIPHPSKTFRSHHKTRMSTTSNISDLQAPYGQQDDIQIDSLCIALSRFGHEDDTSRMTPQELGYLTEKQLMDSCMPQQAMCKKQTQPSYQIPIIKIDLV